MCLQLSTKCKTPVDELTFRQ